MARKTKKSLLDDPATAALMKELGMEKKTRKPAVPKVAKKKAARRRRGKPVKCPKIKTEIEKKKAFYLRQVQKKWKILHGSDRRAAGDVSGWFRGFGAPMTGDDPELRVEMIALSNLARFINSERDLDDD